jgi:hypothetical protein
VEEAIVMPPARRWETDGEEEEATVMAPAGIVLVVEVEATDGAAEAIVAIVLQWIGEVTVGAAVAVVVYCKTKHFKCYKTSIIKAYFISKSQINTSCTVRMSNV